MEPIQLKTLLDQPLPEEEVRIETKRMGYGTQVKYFDGIIKRAWQGDSGAEDFGIELYSPTYNSTRTLYVSGNDWAVEPTRHMNAELAAQGDHEREMREREKKSGMFGD
ncbi:hypothetical protein ACFY78_10800 [Streptomyces olindensis]|uniref:hypothetical protein n=1 Tax=Streptomyces olindensis TaxID=358823 RepID=UPI00368846AD